MKEMKIKKVWMEGLTADFVPALLDKEDVGFQFISVVNWDEYPYCPSVLFRMAYTESAILLHYIVKETGMRAVAVEDNGEVWKDSCVEFFSMPVEDGIYYNIECNCAGTLLVGAGAGRNGREHAPKALLRNVQRWSTLGRNALAERAEECSWELALVIPYSTFFKHHITSLAGKTIRANFYKCGDDLQKPHYLSWNPIALEKPDFHCPEFFGQLHFE